MTMLSVWAPFPQLVEVTTGDRIWPMERDERGWWQAEIDELGPGGRYGFVLDETAVRPDPRSASQPDGVDGFSALVDHEAFSWSDGSWRGVSLPGSVLYELHVGTFTPEGTFDAVIGRLSHLVDLGIDAIELLPVAEFAGDRGWGYDGVDLFAPHHAYGGPEGLKRLVDAAHAQGIGVIVDVVYNHLGPAGNYLPEFGPYFSEQHRTNWGPAINFDGPGSHEVRRFVIDNALMWLRDYHADGLRIDAVHAIVDDSSCHLLEDLAVEVDALATHERRPLFLIAESDLNDPRLVRSRDAGGFGLQAAWADEWHHAVHTALTGERAGYYEDFGSLPLLAKALRQAWVYDGMWSAHRGRVFGQSPAGLSGHHFVVCNQNHDQAGNRAAGERSGHLLTEGRLRVAAALLLCGPFTPMLFQGEEWGATTPFQYFTNFDDELGVVVSEGRRREFAHFGWAPEDVPDPQDPATFAGSKLAWDEIEAAGHASLLDWHQRLIDLRRAYPALSDPRLDRTGVEVDEDHATLVVTRGTLRLLVNLGERPANFHLGPDELILAASHPDVGRTPVVDVPPDVVVIVGPCPSRHHAARLRQGADTDV